MKEDGDRITADIVEGLLKTGWVALTTADQISDLAGLAGLAKGLIKAGVKVLVKGGVRKFFTESGEEISEAEAKRRARAALGDGAAAARKKGGMKAGQTAAANGLWDSLTAAGCAVARQWCIAGGGEDCFNGYRNCVNEKRWDTTRWLLPVVADPSREQIDDEYITCFKR